MDNEHARTYAPDSFQGTFADIDVFTTRTALSPHGYRNAEHTARMVRYGCRCDRQARPVAAGSGQG